MFHYRQKAIATGIIAEEEKELWVNEVSSN